MRTQSPLPLGMVMMLLLPGASALGMQRRGPQVERAEASPSLVPLPMHTSGRALTERGSDGTVWTVSQWPGTAFHASFRGKQVFFRVGPSHEILHVVIDGGAPLILVDPQPGLYRAGPLHRGPHTVEVQVVTESQKGLNRFGGFAVPSYKEQGELPKPLGRQIEFIGDSHTVGYGDTSAKTTCTPEEVWATTDTSQSFGALLAAHYGAEDRIQAISGRGIVRNYDGTAGDTLPTVYPYVLFDKQQRDTAENWRPQLIVIALGTNDFSTPLHAGEPWASRDALHAAYEMRYFKFLRDLRAANPGVFFLLWGTEMAHGEIEVEEAKVVQQAEAQGDDRIAFLPVDHLAFTGCHAHPSLADHRTLRDRMVDFIDAHAERIWGAAPSTTATGSGTAQPAPVQRPS